MQSGHLRHRVTLQAQAVTRNAYGEEIVTWTDLACLWADVRPLAARERYMSSADQTQSAADYRIEIRWRSDISSTQRIAYGTRIFDIEGHADPDGRRRRLRLNCREVLV